MLQKRIFPLVLKIGYFQAVGGIRKDSLVDAV